MVPCSCPPPLRSNTSIIPLAYGITDWLVEPIIRLLVTAIVLRSCFLSSPQVAPRFEHASEVLRAVVANWAVPCRPGTQRLGSDPHRMQPGALVA